MYWVFSPGSQCSGSQELALLIFWRCGNTHSKLMGGCLLARLETGPAVWGAGRPVGHFTFHLLVHQVTHQQKHPTIPTSGWYEYMSMPKASLPKCLDICADQQIRRTSSDLCNVDNSMRQTCIPNATSSRNQATWSKAKANPSNPTCYSAHSCGRQPRSGIQELSNPMYGSQERFLQPPPHQK